MRLPVCVLAGVLQMVTTTDGASAQSTTGLSARDSAALRAFADRDGELVMSRNWRPSPPSTRQTPCGCLLISPRFKVARRFGDG
jgi:hypothetical protein